MRLLTTLLTVALALTPAIAKKDPPARPLLDRCTSERNRHLKCGFYGNLGLFGVAKCREQNGAFQWTAIEMCDSWVTCMGQNKCLKRLEAPGQGHWMGDIDDDRANLETGPFVEGI